MARSPSLKRRASRLAPIHKRLRVFAWNLHSLSTPFEQQSLALNTIERGRAWHWRLLPAGWADNAFILRHGQIKTKNAFATFFSKPKKNEVRTPKHSMKIRKPPAGESPLAWEAVKMVFDQNPKLKKAGALAGSQALLNEHLVNQFGRFSFAIDLHSSREVNHIHASFTEEERKRIHLVSRANPEMYVYEVSTQIGPARIEIAKQYLRHRLAPVRSKHIPGLKVVHFTDLIDAKISALSTRGYARDFVDLYTAHLQRDLDWRGLLVKASRDQLNDYNPVELENNLKLIETELAAGTLDLPCSQPPQFSELHAFLEELRIANAGLARELTQINGETENDG